MCSVAATWAGLWRFKKALRQGPCPTAVQRAAERLDDQSFRKLRADRVLHGGGGCEEQGAPTEGGELSGESEAQL